jgi:hypothetical protein
LKEYLSKGPTEMWSKIYNSWIEQWQEQRLEKYGNSESKQVLDERIKYRSTFLRAKRFLE